MQAHRTPPEFREIQHLMHRLDGIYFRWLETINVKSLCRLDSAVRCFIILLDHSEVLNPEPAGRYRHPAVLPGVIVDGRSLADLPAEGNQLEEMVLKNEIARVLLLAEEKIGRE